MVKMHFPNKWRCWIKDCLSSILALVLVNTFPTEEFRLGRGLRQGCDPLFTFFFHISVEVFNSLLKDFVNNGLYFGNQVGQNN